MTWTTEARRSRRIMDSTDPDRLRVVIADDHPFYRSALARMLERNGFEVIAEVANGEAAVHAVEQTHPDVVVVDLNMPGISGLDATRQICDLAGSAPVIVVSV